jgi:hypothetical protein
MAHAAQPLGEHDRAVAELTGHLPGVQVSPAAKSVDSVALLWPPMVPLPGATQALSGAW